VRPPYKVEVARDVTIPSLDGDHSLSADLYRPACDEVAPALVMLVPYRKDAGIGIKTESSLCWLAGHGYRCLLVDFSGTGSSEGRMRPPFDAREADDAVAAINWAAAQPWCNGRTGMWGSSYGAIVTMRTASTPPPSLKAIIPINGATDAEREFIHPHGALGGLAGVTYWGTLALANHVLPPIRNFHDEDEQVRWRRRVEEFEPWIMDLVRNGPGASAWRDRAFDPSAIEVPALCVAGWRDLFHEAQIRAFEQMRGPKKLIVGPWMHTSPDSSPFEPVDFMSLALRWWDYWLRDIENGVLDEPMVTVYVQGHSAGWRGYTAWPPAESELRMATAADTALHAGSRFASATDTEDVIAEYDPDPTIGSLGGLWSVGGDVVGLPLDQHDDDMRGVAVTSEPLEADVLVAGRPAVTVRLICDATVPPPERLVVRLTDVDRAGRSAFITSGVACPNALHDTLVVPLYPTAYRLAAGHRLRVALSDSDFPRLWPVARPRRLRIAGVELSAPTAAESSGGHVDLPKVGIDSGTEAFELAARWEITRDPPRNGVEVVMGDELAGPTAGAAHQFEVRQDFRASVRRGESDARFLGAVTQTSRLQTGEVIEVVVNTELTAARLRADATVDVQGARVFSRRWDVARAVDAAGSDRGLR
jgi:putative CocE/NonD family hydrolase